MVAEGEAVDGVGSRLRRARRQLGLALGDLPGLTGSQFTAAAVGSYEREFRWPTVERLDVLCGYYGVPLVEVLTGHPGPAVHDGAPATAAAAADAGTAREMRALARLGASVTHRRAGPARQSASTGMPRLRHGDLEVLAVVLDTSAARLRRLLPDTAPGIRDAAPEPPPRPGPPVDPHRPARFGVAHPLRDQSDELRPLLRQRCDPRTTRTCHHDLQTRRVLRWSVESALTQPGGRGSDHSAENQPALDRDRRCRVVTPCAKLRADHVTNRSTFNEDDDSGCRPRSRPTAGTPAGRTSTGAGSASSSTGTATPSQLPELL
jgi:transcriptional regulator with XRE-family HTH domain